MFSNFYNFTLIFPRKRMWNVNSKIPCLTILKCLKFENHPVTVMTSWMIQSSTAYRGQHPDCPSFSGQHMTLEQPESPLPLLRVLPGHRLHTISSPKCYFSWSDTEIDQNASKCLLFVEGIFLPGLTRRKLPTKPPRPGEGTAEGTSAYLSTLSFTLRWVILCRADLEK